jgi:glycosyltransferase involved in cell wall biosynthesis
MAADLSVVIITLNEEANIVACIESVKDAAEVVVVDSGSDDRTVELARRAGARVTMHPMTDFSDQRNYAESLATKDWVLSLDADERVTPELMSEINAAIAANTHVGYMIPELNEVFRKPMQHGGWHPQRHLRLSKRGRGSWHGNVMEAVDINSGSVGRFRSPILHFGHPDIHTFLIKLDRYSTMEAEKHVSRATFTLGALAAMVPLPYFLYKFILQGGFLDGWQGLAAALLLSFYKSLTYMKAIELRERKKPART